MPIHVHSHLLQVEEGISEIDAPFVLTLRAFAFGIQVSVRGEWTERFLMGFYTDLYIMDWRMEEKGVTPIPVAMRTACSARKISLAGAPKGPSRWI